MTPDSHDAEIPPRRRNYLAGSDDMTFVQKAFANRSFLGWLVRFHQLIDFDEFVLQFGHGNNCLPSPSASQTLLMTGRGAKTGNRPDLRAI